MKTRSAGTSSWLLICGAAAVLLIGGFARFDTSGGGNGNLSSISVFPPSAALEAADAVEPAGDPALPASLSPGLDEVIKLAQAHVGDDVVLAYLQNCGRIYNPTADEILYLTDLGLSQKVIEALYARKLADSPAITAGAASRPPSPPGFELAPPSSELAAREVSASDPNPPAGAGREPLISPPPDAAEEAQPPQAPTASYFYDGLAPYGSWVDLGQDGWCWQPTVMTMAPDWQPYRDHGCWLYTDSGWYWQSDYSWGWAPFHYGRWLNNARLGWVWNPGATWAPAWVAWRNTADYAGWAPLPPGAPVNSGVVDWGFALSPSSFTFVRLGDFTASAVAAFAAPAGNAASIFKASVPVNNYVMSGGKISNLGIGAAQIAAATHKAVKQFSLQDVFSPGSANKRMGGGGLAVYRPSISEKAAQATSSESDSRLAQLGPAEENGVPARDILARDDASPARNDNQNPVAMPRTPPPDARLWRTRKFSFSGGASRANFGGASDAGRVASQGGAWPRRPRSDAHGSRQPAAEPAPPFFRPPEPADDRRSYYENSFPGQRSYGEAGANQARSAEGESRVAGTQGTSKK